MRKYWFMQIFIQIIVISFGFIIHLFMDTGDLFEQNRLFSRLFIIFICAAALFAITLSIYYYSKLFPAFFRSSVWKYMDFISIGLLVISFVGFIMLGTLTSFLTMLEEQKWLFYLIAYLFLWLLYMLVFSIIQKHTSKDIAIDMNIRKAWIYSNLLIVAILFLFPM